MNTLSAHVRMYINAPAPNVWDALINPVQIKKYLHGTNAISDWKVGSALNFEGEWKGKTYHDKGVILKLVPEKLLQYSWLSSMSGLEDKPENYMIVTYELSPANGGTEFKLTQENIADEASRKGSEENWEAVLRELKKIVEH